MQRLQVIQADTYVIAVQCDGIARKLFQIIAARDGGLYVAFPYSPFDQGRVGIIEVKANAVETIIGEGFPLTSHHVKYSHHPTGRVQFSQTGRVKSVIGRSGIPFGQVSGHIFSVTFQGISRYPAGDKKGFAKYKRTLVPFEGTPLAKAYKFVAYIHSANELATRVKGLGDALWLTCVTPSGRLNTGITLATKFRDHCGLRFILLQMETTAAIRADIGEFLMFIGGFDPPSISMDPVKDTQALMFFYPETSPSNEMIRNFGTIDL